MRKVHSQQGITTKRERSQERPFTLYERVFSAMQAAADADPNATVADLAAAAVNSLQQSPRKKVALEILAGCNGAPTCGICGLRIFMDEPDDSPARFSVDHIIRHADGGLWEIGNCRPAHTLCNSTRTVFELGKQPRTRTRRKLEQMKQYLRDRMAMAA